MNWKSRVLWALEDGGGAGAGAGAGGAGAGGGDTAAASRAAAAGGDAAAAAKAPADAAAAAGAGAGGGDRAAAAAAAAGTGYRPEGLPDHLYGKDDRETIDRLKKSVDGFRTAQAERGEMPKDAKGYDFKPSEAVAPYAKALGNDPFFAQVQEYAFKAGIPTKQFSTFVNDILGHMISGQMVDAPFSADKERETLLPDIKDPKEREVLADRMARDATARVETYKAQGMPEHVATDLLSRMDRAATISLVNWIATQRRETGPALGGTSDGKAITAGELRQRNADPRNDPNSAKYDKGFAEETDRLYKQMYPGGGDR